MEDSFVQKPLSLFPQHALPHNRNPKFVPTFFVDDVFLSSSPCCWFEFSPDGLCLSRSTEGVSHKGGQRRVSQAAKILPFA